MFLFIVIYRRTLSSVFKIHLPNRGLLYAAFTRNVLLEIPQTRLGSLPLTPPDSEGPFYNLFELCFFVELAENTLWTLFAPFLEN